MSSVLWRCLYTQGHDVCWLEPTAAGWQLEGSAVFRRDGFPARLSYRLSCDSAWRSREGRVEGRVGASPVALDIVRADDGVWRVNGAPVPGLDGCMDLDFGFTPATNLPQLRRMNLATGESAEITVAWIDVGEPLQPLAQYYERRTETTYWYESPTGYTALLELGAGGFIRLYPDLWEAEP